MMFRYLSSLMTVALICFSAGTFAQASQTQTHPLAAMADALADKQSQWLSTDGEQFLALYTKERSGSARGGVLMLTASPRGPAESPVLLNLHHILPDRNWHSLLVSPVSAKPAPAETTGEASIEQAALMSEAEPPAAEPQPADQATDENIPPPSAPVTTASISSSVKSGVQFLNQHGIFNMVILGEGNSAARVMHYVADLSGEQAKQVRGIILLNPRNQLDDHALAGMITSLKIPVLDIYTNLDYRDREEALTRQQQSQALPAGQYTQIELPRVSTIGDGENLISRRIRGWLNKTASGFEVKADR